MNYVTLHIFRSLRLNVASRFWGRDVTFLRPPLGTDMYTVSQECNAFLTRSGERSGLVGHHHLESSASF